MNADPMPIRGPVALVGLAPPDLEHAHDASRPRGGDDVRGPHRRGADAGRSRHLGASGCALRPRRGRGAGEPPAGHRPPCLPHRRGVPTRAPVGSDVGGGWDRRGSGGHQRRAPARSSSIVVRVGKDVALSPRRADESGRRGARPRRRIGVGAGSCQGPRPLRPGGALGRPRCPRGLLPALPARPASRAQRSCLPRGRWARWRPGRRSQGGGGVPIDRRPPHRGRRTMEQRCGAMRSGHRSSRPRPRDQRRPGGRRRYGRRSLGRASALPGHHPRDRTSRAQPGTGPLRSHTDPARTEAPGEGPASAAPSPLGRFRHPRSGRSLRAPSPPGRDCSCVTRCDSSPGAPPLPSPPQPPPAPDAARARRPAPSTPYERGSAE